MTWGDRGRDDRDPAISRRRFGRLLAGLLGVLGPPIDPPADAAAKKNGKRKKSRDHGRGGRRLGGSTPGRGDDGSSALLDAEERLFLTLLNDYRAA
ncbi:MAG: hypothetical protein ACRERD_06150, partial [Candidatus Binatia bacterium]